MSNQNGHGNGHGGHGNGQGGGKGRSASSRRRRQQKAKPVDLWRPVPRLPDPAPITPSDAPATLLRSLGEAPLHGQGAIAEHYMSAVVDSAARLATALAASVDLLADLSDDDAG
ncbi:MAG: hypothetical protein AB7L84_09680 [Acidimicrobiia bacterium]